MKCNLNGEQFRCELRTIMQSGCYDSDPEANYYGPERGDRFTRYLACKKWAFTIWIIFVCLLVVGLPLTLFILTACNMVATDEQRHCFINSTITGGRYFEI